MAIRRLYTRQDGKWAWELVVDGNVVATDGGEGYADEAEAREIVNRIIGGEFADAEKRIRRAPKASVNEPAVEKTPEKQPAAKKTTKAASDNESAAKTSPAKKSPAKKTASEKKTAQKPESPASTSAPRKKTPAKKEASSARIGKTATRAIPGAFTTADVRAWAKRNGYVVSSRGRVPKHISGAYRAAHRP